MSAAATHPYSHAVVIGGSMAGLLAARVLTESFERVTIIDRDSLPQGAELRNGVPQARHVHVLLAHGYTILMALFPGLDDELEAAGVPPMRYGTTDALYNVRSGWTPPFESDLVTRVPSRGLLEWLVRRRLYEITGVSIMDETQVNRVTASPDNNRVTGVEVQGRKGERETRLLEADLVVDASGRDSHSSQWLQEMGYDAPEESVVNSFLGYATRWYRRPPNAGNAWQIMFIQARPPEIKRGGAIFQVENDTWIVSAGGINKDYPPTDEAGFMDFIQSLPAPEMYEAIKDAEPLTPIYGYQRTQNQMRHYEKLARLPGHFVVIGDSACAFNPIYGQGMTVAAMQALTLRQMLHDTGDLDRLPPTFYRQNARTVKNAWLLATGEDLRYPETVGGKVTAFDRLTQKYMDRAVQVMPRSEAVTRAVVAVVNLQTPPTALFKPDLVVKVLFG
jgi:2-polyprenyl-6-methoxyphenol hydroxylase-like FAD-dependent oxidoreductase